MKDSRLAATWRFRAHRELESELRFRRIALRLHETGAPASWVERARAAADDEGRHAASCAELARRLGADGLRPAAIVLPEVAPVRLCTELRVLYENVAMGCVCETLNVALLRAELRELDDPRTRRLTRDILRDEVRHARFGWFHLAAMAARGVAHQLNPFIAQMVAASFTEELFDVDASLPAERGGLSTQQRVAISRDTLEHVILAGFAQLGLDVAPAFVTVERFAQLE